MNTGESSESVGLQHALLECRRYEEERKALKAAAEEAIYKVTLNIGSQSTYYFRNLIAYYLKETGLMNRI